MFGGNVELSLKEYERKRDFEKTTEPKSEVPSKQGNTYVMHKHDASHLHYDLRLEMDGTLKSWAVPKEPPRSAGVKRLALAVEDHELDYADFEGRIPDGEYGAGTVKIWDRGTYILKERTVHLIEFTLAGKKLKGDYVLIHTGENKWLLFKKKPKDVRE